MRRGVATLLLLAACYTVESRPRAIGPLNVCAEFPCERYERGRTAATCRTEGRCTAGPPSFSYFIVVHAPATSLVGAGLTFVATEQDLRSSETNDTTSDCSPPECLLLPIVADVRGRYVVTPGAASTLGRSLGGVDVAIPVNASFVTIGQEQTSGLLPDLPLDEVFAFPIRQSDQATGIVFSRALALGRYRRVMYPQPPFDAFFPPIEGEITVRGPLEDFFTLNVADLDDATGIARHVIVDRAQGLDGFRVWFGDRLTRRRISLVRELSGTHAEVDLHTVGQKGGVGNALKDTADLIVEPPSTALAVPRVVNELTGGSGLEITYPVLPPPVAVSAFVASPSRTVLPARVTLTSTTIYTEDSVGFSPILVYTTTVLTNEEGRFSTVLPPGTYDLRIEGTEGSGFGRRKTSIDVPVTGLDVSPVFEVPLLTQVRGRAVLSDGRRLAGADVLAVADRAVPVSGDRPRAGRARTNAEGEYTLAIDEGAYVISITPQEGSGFPRALARHAIPPGETRLPDIKVPPPNVLSFTVKQRVGTEVSSPAAGAVVRVFRLPAGASGGIPVEVARALTEANGSVEILLAEEAR